MGLQISRIWERMFGKKEMRILMVGLDAAGKVGDQRYSLFSSLKFPNIISNAGSGASMWI